MLYIVTFKDGSWMKVKSESLLRAWDWAHSEFGADIQSIQSC